MTFYKTHQRLLAALVLIALMSAFAPPLLASEEKPEPPKPVETCLQEFSEFQEGDGDYQPFGSANKEFTTVSELTDELDAVGDKYHGYISCIFKEAETQILESVEADELCVEQTQLVEMGTNTSPEALLPFLLKAHNAYRDHITNLYKFTRLSIFAVDLNTSFAALKPVDRQVTDEINNSIVALDTSLKMLSNMRQMLIMHIHFKCIMENLDDYRNLLGKLRDIVMQLPGRIIDASKSK